MGQLYYAQTQLYSTVLGGENQRTVRIKHRDPLLTSRSSSFRFFSQILYQGPNQLIYTRGWRGSYARRRCTASLRSVVHHVRAGHAEYPGGAGLQADRILGLCGGGRARRRRHLGNIWVPICLGDHVWVFSVGDCATRFACRLGCPVSSGLKMKAPARSVATHE